MCNVSWRIEIYKEGVNSPKAYTQKKTWPTLIHNIAQLYMEKVFKCCK